MSDVGSKMINPFPMGLNFIFQRLFMTLIYCLHLSLHSYVCNEQNVILQPEILSLNFGSVVYYLNMIQQLSAL